MLELHKLKDHPVQTHHRTPKVQPLLSAGAPADSYLAGDWQRSGSDRRGSVLPRPLLPRLDLMSHTCEMKWMDYRLVSLNSLVAQSRVLCVSQLSEAAVFLVSYQ